MIFLLNKFLNKIKKIVWFNFLFKFCLNVDFKFNNYKTLVDSKYCTKNTVKQSAQYKGIKQLYAVKTYLSISKNQNYFFFHKNRL